MKNHAVGDEDRNQDENIELTVKLTAIDNVDISTIVVVVVVLFFLIPLIMQCDIGVVRAVDGKVLHQSVH